MKDLKPLKLRFKRKKMIIYNNLEEFFPNHLDFPYSMKLKWISIIEWWILKPRDEPRNIFILLPRVFEIIMFWFYFSTSYSKNPHPWLFLTVYLLGKFFIILNRDLWLAGRFNLKYSFLFLFLFSDPCVRRNNCPWLWIWAIRISRYFE